MKGLFKRIQLNSIRFEIIVSIMAVFMPLIALLTYNSFYAIHVVRNQVAESYNNTVSLYMMQIDENLGNIDKYLINMAVFNTDIKMMKSSDENDAYLSRININKSIAKDILLFQFVDSLFTYSLSNEKYIYALSKTASLDEHDDVKGFVTKFLDETDNGDNLIDVGWFIKKINQSYYLLRVIRSDSLYIGAWLKVDGLLAPLESINYGEKGAILFKNDQGEPMSDSVLIQKNDIHLKHETEKYYISGQAQKYLVVDKNSSAGKFSLVALIPEEKILENLPYFQRISTFISIGAIIMIPLLLLFLRKNLLIPIKHIMITMKHIMEGNLDLRIEKYPTSYEFQMVNDTFNRMMSQIHDLKISVYEEQLEKQKAELLYLQLQIKPHFFLNLLNSIYHFAQRGNNDLIQEMVMCMVQYFRYMFRSNMEFVLLEEELQYIRNYIHIQEIRYPDSLKCSIEVPENLLSTSIPPLIIQSFVENTIKHALTMDNTVQLIIKIEPDHNEYEPCIKITVRDTGSGFDEDILEKLKSRTRIVSEKGEHIGIWNVQQRLELLYAGHAGITFTNGSPTGSIVEIIIPIDYTK